MGEFVVGLTFRVLLKPSLLDEPLPIYMQVAAVTLSLISEYECVISNN